ncbi:MAG: hypothetical protein ACK5ED_04650, partial [Gemmatimonadota bacterium]
ASGERGTGYVDWSNEVSDIEQWEEHCCETRQKDNQFDNGMISVFGDKKAHIKCAFFIPVLFQNLEVY